MQDILRINALKAEILVRLERTVADFEKASPVAYTSALNLCEEELRIVREQIHLYRMLLNE